MTHLNPIRIETSFFAHTVVRSLTGVARSILGRLARMPVAAARSLLGISDAVGHAAGMAYADPFQPKQKNRK